MLPNLAVSRATPLLHIVVLLCFANLLILSKSLQVTFLRGIGDDVVMYPEEPVQIAEKIN